MMNCRLIFKCVESFAPSGFIILDTDVQQNASFGFTVESVITTDTIFLSL